MNRDAFLCLLIADEGLKRKPYKDTVGKWTIGIGRNLDDVGITEAEAKYLCLNDIAKVERGLDGALPWWRGLSERRQLVVASMCFQLGLEGLMKFTNTLEAMQREDWEAASEGMLASLWATQTPARAERLAKMMVSG
jgi:lysozyme